MGQDECPGELLSQLVLIFGLHPLPAFLDRRLVDESSELLRRVVRDK